MPQPGMTKHHPAPLHGSVTAGGWQPPGPPGPTPAHVGRGLLTQPWSGQLAHSTRASHSRVLPVHEGLVC